MQRQRDRSVVRAIAARSRALHEGCRSEAAGAQCAEARTNRVNEFGELVGWFVLATIGRAHIAGLRKSLPKDASAKATRSFICTDGSTAIPYSHTHWSFVRTTSAEN